jgi:acyl-coenzyme A thioesterase PaaI-like protein
VVVQVEVVDAGDDDRLCAVGTATFALVAQPAADASSA